MISRLHECMYFRKNSYDFTEVVKVANYIVQHSSNII